MKRRMLFSIAMVCITGALLAGCGGIHIPPAPITTLPVSDVSTRDSSAVQLGTALATVEEDSAADQSALDSLHERTTDTPASPRTNQPLAGEDVRHEAEQ